MGSALLQHPVRRAASRYFELILHQYFHTSLPSYYATRSQLSTPKKEEIFLRPALWNSCAHFHARIGVVNLWNLHRKLPLYAKLVTYVGQQSNITQQREREKLSPCLPSLLLYSKTLASSYVCWCQMVTWPAQKPVVTDSASRMGSLIIGEIVGLLVFLKLKWCCLNCKELWFLQPVEQFRVCGGDGVCLQVRLGS